MPEISFRINIANVFYPSNVSRLSVDLNFDMSKPIYAPLMEVI